MIAEDAKRIATALLLSYGSEELRKAIHLFLNKYCFRGYFNRHNQVENLNISTLHRPNIEEPRIPKT